MLKAEHITKQYQIPGGRHTVFDAVSDVSIELGNGGVAAIVGESGSGKSTLARVLSYVERPDGGRVFLDGLRCPPAEERNPRCKREGPACDAERFGVFRPSPERGGHSGGALRLLFHMGDGGEKTAVS